MLTRRGFVGITLGLIAAPAIVRASSLMPVRAEWRYAYKQLREVSIFSDTDGKFGVWIVEQVDEALIPQLTGVLPDVIKIWCEPGRDQLTGGYVSRDLSVERPIVGHSESFLSAEEVLYKSKEILSEYGVFVYPPGPGGIARFLSPPMSEPISRQLKRIRCS